MSKDFLIINSPKRKSEDLPKTLEEWSGPAFNWGCFAGLGTGFSLWTHEGNMAGGTHHAFRKEEGYCIQRFSNLCGTGTAKL